MDAISLRAASATIKSHTQELRPMLPPFAMRSVILNMALDSDFSAPIATTTRPDSRKSDRSARLVLRNIFQSAITLARVVTTAGGRSAGTWISRIAGDATRVRASEQAFDNLCSVYLRFAKHVRGHSGGGGNEEVASHLDRNHSFNSLCSNCKFAQFGLPYPGNPQGKQRATEKSKAGRG